MHLWKSKYFLQTYLFPQQYIFVPISKKHHINSFSLAFFIGSPSITADNKVKKKLECPERILYSKEETDSYCKIPSAWFMSQVEIHHIICICSLDRYGKWISRMKGECHKAPSGWQGCWRVEEAATSGMNAELDEAGVTPIKPERKKKLISIL